jgi:Pentapeptide repeats (8 copies)
MIFISLCCYTGTLVDGDDVILIVLDSSPETNVAVLDGHCPAMEVKHFGSTFVAGKICTERIGADLHGADLSGAELRRADLHQVVLFDRRKSMSYGY